MSGRGMTMKIQTMPLMSAPEMLRSDTAHVGTAPLTDLTARNAEQARPTKKTGAFESYLLNAVSTVNAQQLDVDNLTKQYITDPDSVNVEDITTAMAKAQMSLSLAQTVIDRITTGWNELSTTR